MTQAYDSKDCPMPLDFFLRRYGISRTTAWRWEKMRLRILHVGGKRFIRPSDWAAFIEQQNSKVTGGSHEQ